MKLKGKGAGSFEAFFESGTETYLVRFLRTAREMGRYLRIDIMINDRAGILNIRTAENAAGMNVSRFSIVLRITSPGADKEPGRRCKVWEIHCTWDLLKSEIYFCIYEKDYEQ